MKHEIDIAFVLEAESKCEHMSINNSSIYCFYLRGRFNMVQIRSIKYPEQKEIDLKTSVFGKKYKVLIDNAMYVVFIFKHLSGTGMEILKIDKQRNFFDQVFIKSNDLGSLNLFVTDFAVYFNSDSNILSLLLINNMNQSLYVYTAFFTANNMDLQKIRTINDSFDLFPLDPTIWGIQCDPHVYALLGNS